MNSKKSVLLLSLFVFTACSNPGSVNLPTLQRPSNLNASAINAKSTVDSAFLQAVVSSLDLNKDGKIDALEAPILVGGRNTPYLYNSDGSAITGYLPIPGKELPVATILEMMHQGADLSIMTSKSSEKNKERIIANFVSTVLKDPQLQSGKILGYSTTVGYFTGKTTAVVRSMDASILSREVKEQLTIGNGTVNGVPYQAGNGSITLLPRLTTIDGKYRARLHFGYYDYFESGFQLIGYHKISDAAKLIVTE